MQNTSKNRQISHRVVITGMGLVSPLGNNLTELSNHVFNGISGIKRMDVPFINQLECKIAAPSQFNPADYFTKRRYSILDRTSQMALHASNEAIKHANLTITDELKPRMGIYLGTGMGGANSFEEGYQKLYRDNANRIKPFTVLMGMYNASASAVALDHKFTGQNQTFSTACSSSAIAIGEASRLIRHGYASTMLAGGSEALLTYGSIKAWEALTTLAQEDPEDLTRSCKPFSANRTGLVLAEGAAILVLEAYEHAKARGAKVYAEIVGYATVNDSSHITQPSVDGQAASMQAVLLDAGIDASNIQYINAHGTGTLLNDATETNAVKKVFGEHAYKLSMSSTKSMHGHLMGAAGALEAIITTLAIRANKLPPTTNLTQPDPECDLDYIPNVSKPISSLEYAMTNSFAFGGTGASLILKKIHE